MRPLAEVLNTWQPAELLGKATLIQYKVTGALGSSQRRLHGTPTLIQVGCGNLLCPDNNDWIAVWTTILILDFLHRLPDTLSQAVFSPLTELSVIIQLHPALNITLITTLIKVTLDSSFKVNLALFVMYCLNITVNKSSYSMNTLLFCVFCVNRDQA